MDVTMADRALFAALQKVQGDVEKALQETRRREEEARKREAAGGLKKKASKPVSAAKRPAPVPKTEPKAETPVEERVAVKAPSEGASAFASLLAGAARGATFRKAGALKSEAEAGPRKKAPPKTPKTETPKAPDPKPKVQRSAPAVKSSSSGAESGKRPPERPRSGRVDRRTRPVRTEAADRRLSFEERQNPIPPFELAPGLPVSERADEVRRAIEANRVVIVCGETGSGKTTQLPKIALLAGRGKTGMIAHTQPRRIAASSIAKRIAEEMKTPLGEVVGFKVRFTDETTPGATIKLMTDGILLAETQTDPLLRAYDTVIIDEAHERSINIDFLLGYLKRLLVKRPDLKVIVTSATIDAERFAEHFTIDGEKAPVLTISGRTYPVEIRWRPLENLDETDDRTMLEAIDRAVSELETAGRGDILVFLPGEREIRDCEEHLRKNRSPLTTEILPLFARLSASDQERVFRPGRGRRIVLATNVAETSITVPGIRYVVDPGLARVKRYSYRNKVEQLLMEPVSQASANQRAGRCGRVADGICIRLYDETDFARRPAFTDPEIMRSNLAAVILKAMSLKLGDIRTFPFVQSPPPKAFADGFAILQELGALDEANALTEVGRELARLPVDPKLARMLLAGSRSGSLRELLIIASGLSVQDPRERPAEARQAADEAHKRLSDEKSDFLSFVRLWDWYEKEKSEKESNRKFEILLKKNFLSPRRIREWRDVRRQLEDLCRELSWRINTEPATYEEVHRALLTGLLGNIALKTVESRPKEPPYAGARGIRFWIWPGSPRAKKSGRWIVAAQIMETTKLYAHCVADIEPEWIEAAAGTLIRRSWSEPHWEKHRGEVAALERGTLYGLTVYQGRRVSFAPHDPALSHELFIREGLVEGEIEGKFPFLTKNLRLVEEIRELEHKTRRPDVLVDESLIFDFYDKVIPQEVCSQRSLEAWLKGLSQEDEKALHLSRGHLMRHQAEGAAAAYFPKAMTFAGVQMPLTYHFEPGSPRDGVTLAVPIFALNQIDPVRAEWLVPGMVKEKAQALLKTLPQKIRRHCVPLPDYAAGFYARTAGAEHTKGFAETLADDVRSETGMPCAATDFKLEQLAPHLTLNMKVVDEHGRQLAMGRSLAELRSELGDEAQKTFQTVAQQDARVAGELQDAITDWTFGDLPELMEISRRGQTLIGHPALVDHGTACALEVFDDPVEAKKVHRRGLRRLFRLTLKEQVRFVERSLRDLGHVQMAASVVPGLSDTFEDFGETENDIVDCVLEATAMTEPWPVTESQFRERREDVRGRLSLVAGEVVRLLEAMVEEASPIPLKLKRMASETELAADVTGQLRGLFPAHFLVTVPLTQLRHYPRYLKAVTRRLERYAENPAQDRARMADIVRLRAPWERLSAKRRGVEDPRLDEFRWLLEELRVSLFAQQLRTPMPVSVKRLERVWGAILSLGGQ